MTKRRIGFGMNGHGLKFNKFWTYRRILLSRRFVIAVLRSRRNIAASSLGRPLPSGPYMAELDVTYRCNCRCKMCQRWRDPRGGELTLEEYRELARVFAELGVHQVSIAGGEPLLRGDIFSIIGCFSQLGMSVNLCTNGILLDHYADLLCGSGAACVTVSLDGASARTHDAIRGAPGSHEKIESAVRALARRPAGSKPLVRVRMTVSDLNVDELGAFYRKWANVVDHALVQPVHYCRDAHYTGSKRQAFGLDPVRLAEQLRDFPAKRDVYLGPLLESLERDGGYPRHRCYAGVLMVRIDPWGNVYPCLEQHVCVGSVRERDFRSIWNSSAFNRVRRRIALSQDCRCWYNNTAMISHYATWLQRTIRCRKNPPASRRRNRPWVCQAQAKKRSGAWPDPCLHHGRRWRI